MQTALTCAGCGKPMSEEADADMTFHKCKNCGGVFLDKGELNELETGMAGDIEYNTVDQKNVKETNRDKFPARNCPRCVSQKMEKKALLVYSNIIFDYCSKCGGFYLDKGEVEQMNAHLESLTKSKRPEKFRGEINNHLVHLELVEGEDLRAVLGGLAVIPEEICVLKISIYFKKPLNLGLRIHSEKWTERFMDLIGASHKKTIATGDKKFDSLYLVQGTNEDQIKSLLSGVKNELIDIHQNRPKIFSKSGTIEILDNKVVYSEGPYSGEVTYDVQQDSAGVVKRLLRLATLFDKN